VNETLFCEKSRELRLGGGNSVEGACDSISDVAIEGYVGIPKCAFITCEEVEDAVCYDEGKKVDCETRLSDDDVAEAARVEDEMDRWANIN